VAKRLIMSRWRLSSYGSLGIYRICPVESLMRWVSKR
jgi:hypothetical protein